MFGQWLRDQRHTQEFFIPLSLLFRHSVLSDFLRPQRTAYARLPCPPVSPRVCSNSLSIELVMLSNHLLLCRHLLLLPSIFPSIRVFYSELVSALRDVPTEPWNRDLGRWTGNMCDVRLVNCSRCISCRVEMLALLGK